jgi:DNA-directed RNA polymerase specialized sigma24 family protein
MMELTMFKASQVANVKDMDYATEADFCRIFNSDMSSLYLLSLLLTGDPEKAEQCFVAGLENAVSRNRVFKEWARSWARRTIIQNALRMMKPRQNDGIDVSNSISTNCDDKSLQDRAEIAAVLRLQAFDRFVFVMSVLEDYSDQDCSVLLGCTRRDVLAARTRALQQIGNEAELHLKQEVNAAPEGLTPRDRGGSALHAAA